MSQLKPKRKIIHVLNVLQYSGAEVMLTDAYTFFEKDYDQFVLATGPEIGPYSNKLKEKGFQVIHIKRRKSLSYFVDIFKFFKKNKFDIVHIHASHVYFLNVLLIKIASFKTNIFRTYHDVFHEDTKYNIYKLTIQYFICRNLLNVKGISIGKSVYEVEKRFFKNKTTIINNWIDETKFKPPTPEDVTNSRNELGIKENAFVILTVGTCNNKKCHNDIFESVARIKGKIPNLVFLHRGSGENLEQEKNYVKRLEIVDNVIFVNYIDFLPKIFWAADCFTLASKREGLGDVIIEAIATKLPVVLYDGYGMKDFKPYNDKYYGYWIDPNKERFDEYFEKLYDLKKRNEIIVLKNNAYDFFTVNFSRVDSLKKLMNLYKGIN